MWVPEFIPETEKGQSMLSKNTSVVEQVGLLVARQKAHRGNCGVFHSGVREDFF